MTTQPPQPTGAPVPPEPVAVVQAAALAPGWYFDAGARKYWDGQQWAAVAPPVKTPTNHTFHLIMTLLTFGLWIPVWIIVAIANS